MGNVKNLSLFESICIVLVACVDLLFLFSAWVRTDRVPGSEVDFRKPAGLTLSAREVRENILNTL